MGDSLTSTAREVREVGGPRGLAGANGLRFGPDGGLYVVSAFGSEVIRIDVDSGERTEVSPPGGAIVSADDLDFDSRGVMYLSECMNARVSAIDPDGVTRVIAGDLPGVNGLAVFEDRLFVDECRPSGRLLEVHTDGRPPKLLADGLQLPNALSVGPDRKIYFPLVFAGEVWRVPIDGGEPERFIADLAAPGSVTFDSDGNLNISQGLTGEVTVVDIVSRRRRPRRASRPGIDNVAISGGGDVFVSYYTDGEVAQLLDDGTARSLVPPGLVGPFGLTAVGSTLFVADGFSLVELHADGTLRSSGQFTEAGFPGFVRGIAAAPVGTFLMSTTAGDIASWRPGSPDTAVWISGLDEVVGVAVDQLGMACLAEAGGGRVLRVAANGQTTELAAGLDRPMGIAVVNDECFVTEAGRGRVLEVSDGVRVIAEGLDRPEGIGALNGTVLVVDAGRGEVLAVDSDGWVSTVAADLPTAGSPGRAMLPPLAGLPELVPGPITPFADLSVSVDGRVFVGGNANGSVLELLPPSASIS